MQELMEKARGTTNVLEACKVQGRLLCMESILNQLELCQKALQV